MCLALGTRLDLPSTPRIALQSTAWSALGSMSLERRTDGLGRVGTCGLRRSSSCREQLEGLRKLQPRREAIPGTLLQLLPSVRCKLGEWREATQHMTEATHQSTANTAAGAEEHGEEGTVRRKVCERSATCVSSCTASSAHALAAPPLRSFSQELREGRTTDAAWMQRGAFSADTAMPEAQ